MTRYTKEWLAGFSPYQIERMIKDTELTARYWRMRVEFLHEHGGGAPGQLERAEEKLAGFLLKLLELRA